jgi:hypothetical protein
VLLSSALACAVQQIVVTAEPSIALEEFVALLDDPRVSLGPPHVGAASIRVVEDESCSDCFALSLLDGESLVVTGGAPLGVQYGLAAALEAYGYRFFHPTDTLRPESFVLGEYELGAAAPAMARRGLHLHTLHPIEGTAAMVTDVDDERARRIFDWVVKNRGNFVQWLAMDDVLGNPAAWQALAADRVDAAHARGLDVGIGLQLFGSGNLQLAFDLVDGEVDAAVMAERLHALSDGVEWDHYSLSFGEFAGESPEAFVAVGNDAVRAIQEQTPGATVSTTIHVGNYDDLRVQYRGDEMLYYFLGAELDGVTPWVHTVMYYNLYEDAGGAYLHDDFDEHRAYLQRRLALGEPVGYHPESAYWCAFDDSVPLYLPVYLRSRGRDLQELAPRLQDHVLFSSGWEWGYWQQDYATLRMNYAGHGDWEAITREMFAPLDGLADTVVAVADVEHGALIEERLAPYLAGRDAFMDAGEVAGIVSMPDRVEFDELWAMDAPTRVATAREIASGLAAFADALPAEPNGDDRWSAEVRDGIAITRLRAEWMATLYGAVADGTWAESADGILAEAGTVVARRHGALHDPDPRWTAAEWDNPGLYDYGYLWHAENLCYWERERVQAREVLLGEEASVPGCAFD